MKKNKGFTTPCYMAVKDGNHANRLMIALKSIGDRKVFGIPENVTYPCVCGVSTNIISFGELNDLAGFINCEDNEDLFLALASLRNDSDIHQWFTDGEKWVISDIHSLLELKEYFQLIKFDYSKTHKATVEELIKHFRLERNIMDIKLSKMQIIHLGNICKKGWGGYSKPSDDLEEMVKNGLLTKEAGPFGDVVYRPTNKGRGYINS